MKKIKKIGGIIKKLKLKISSLLERIQFRFFLRKTDLLIFDTIFPNPISGFRFAEFTSLLEHYKNAKIIVNPKDYIVIGQSTDRHAFDLKELKQYSYKSFIKTRIGKPDNLLNAKLFYCVFLNIIYDCLNDLEKNGIDFIFTLYPGGGFNVKDELALKKLKTVLDSKHFKGVMVTQEFTKKFLVENFNCPEEKIHFIFGGIIPQNSINIDRKRRYKKGNSLNICFCSAKYMEKGLDKGYDIFIDAALKLIEKNLNVNFSIIGGFDEKDIALGNHSDKFTFYGYKKYEELSEIFLEQDIIISPNRPFVLSEGAFDGFPLGAVVEAALNGVVPILTDELDQNTIFDDSEMMIITPNTDEVVIAIEKLLNDDQLLQKMSANVVKKCREIYSHDNQLNKRIQILDKFL